ncbi:TPA_asm: coat protein [ssRNA phage SRR6960509_7]|uniref:Coat protein n=1 Tax=ssRNA phage SRR6960509_7 TaxID=2786534 RepID=A0A8S5L573_9VIRU|nr:coat protein [ssRNA phage SRR6960509_7]DAD52572.1 TPA_asm: coat protein [ssRNA phage SRR6960509_7]
MPAMTNLLVKDDANPLVEMTFVPITDTPEPFWRTQIASIPFEGQMRLTQSVIKQKNGGYKITAKLEVPVMETLGASGTSYGYVAPAKVAYVTTAILSVFADKRSTIADRANTLKMMLGLIAGATSTTATGTMNGASAANVYQNSSAPFPLLFTSLVLAS